MTGLHVAIVIIGGLVMAAIYLHGVYFSARSDLGYESDDDFLVDRIGSRREPGLDTDKLAALDDDEDYDDDDDEDYLFDEEDDFADDDVADGAGVTNSSSTTGDPGAGMGPLYVLAFYVVADAGRYFRGEQLQPELERFGLVLSNHGVFQQYPDNDRDHGPLYQVANAIEPGTFDARTLRHIETPGITLFATLPAPRSGELILREMHEVATLIADRLGGLILDNRRQVLTMTRLDQLMAEVRALDTKVLG